MTSENPHVQYNFNWWIFGCHVSFRGGSATVFYTETVSPITSMRLRLYRQKQNGRSSIYLIAWAAACDMVSIA